MNTAAAPPSLFLSCRDKTQALLRSLDNSSTRPSTWRNV